MSNLRESLDFNATFRPTIRVESNDNSLSIKGETEEGHEDKSFLFSSPDFEQEVKDQLNKVISYQRSKLDSFLADTQDRFNDQVSDLEQQVQGFINNP